MTSGEKFRKINMQAGALASLHDGILNAYGIMSLSAIKYQDIYTSVPFDC